MSAGVYVCGGVQGKLGLARLQAWAWTRPLVTAAVPVSRVRGCCSAVPLLTMLQPEGEAWTQGRGYGEDPWAARVWRARAGLRVRARLVTAFMSAGKKYLFWKNLLVPR